MEERYLKFHEKGVGMAMLELAKQYPPKEAIREFVTNSLDARIKDQTIDIAILINPFEKRVIISDNGIAMTYKQLIELPESVGYSKKIGMVDKRGEKGVGLLAFGSLGDVMQIISRPDENSKYGYMRWEIKESKGAIAFYPKEIDSKEVKDLYRNFPHGTTIIIDRVDSHIIDKVFTITNLKNWLTMLYNPALRKNIANILIGRLDKRNMEPKLEPLEEMVHETISSTELEDEIVSIKIKKEEPGDLELLLFVDPTAICDKVAVYSKDVLVYESLAELPEFSKSPVWTSGKVSGYINDYFNKLILGRSGIDRSRNAFKAWYATLTELEEKIRPIVEEKKKHGVKIKENEYIKKVYNVLDDVLRDFKTTEFGEAYARSSTGELVPVIGEEPTEKRGKERSTKPRIRTGKPPGPGTFIYNPDGVIQRVTQKRGVPFSYPQPVDFPLHEMHLRSKLEVKSFGSPVLLINSAHEDYKSRADSREEIILRYILGLMAKGTTQAEAIKAEKKNELRGDKSEIVNNFLEREEYIQFLALKRLKIK